MPIVRAIAKTADRSVVGVVNESARLANAYRTGDSTPDLLDLSLRLASTPCSPLYVRNVSPDRELSALLRSVRAK